MLVIGKTLFDSDIDREIDWDCKLENEKGIMAEIGKWTGLKRV